MKKFYLTQREKDVMELVAQGKNNECIAKTLNITLFTVRQHLKNIYTKMDYYGVLKDQNISVRLMAILVYLKMENRLISNDILL